MFYTYAKFGIQGYVGSIREVGKTLKIRISKTESWKDRDSGERQERTIWNTVTLFERTPGSSAARTGKTICASRRLSDA
ncbi:MAG: hypothetical protein ACK5JR_02140 [Tropicimonas sp.]|uniref:hypothetical protein n=1 Tax=Tropicimonas sp. TaxID=2067044 RepID=UPI003A8BCACD